MKSRSLYLSLFTILAILILVGCLPQETLPSIGPEPDSTLNPPSVDPTIAAVQRLSLNLVSEYISNLPAPQILHDLIGRSDCLMCHKQGVSGATRIPDSHRGLESGTCHNCHVAPASVELSGAELYQRLCSNCHGENGEGIFGPALNVKTFLSTVTDEELRADIVRGRGASEMLAWGDLGLLSNRQIEELVAMIRAWEPTAPDMAHPASPLAVNAAHGDPQRGDLQFAQFCSGCHGLNGEISVGDGFILNEVIGVVDDDTLARQIRGGSEEMPPFHSLLTTDDINDLLALLRSWVGGLQPTPIPIILSGEEVFVRVCARCHGQNGEGGIGPPLNSKEFLSANDDNSIHQWILRGTLGTSMLSWGDLGLLTQDQIDGLTAFIRAWEPTAPSRVGIGAIIPASADLGDPEHGEQFFAQFCSGCHGLIGEKPTGGMVINSKAFLDSLNDDIIASQIQNGGRNMPSFHAILTSQDVNDLLAFMRAGFGEDGITRAVPGFSADVTPILQESCALCHGTAGGWSSATYDEVVNSGDNGPVIIPGDPDASLLIQKMRGTQSIGGQMPLRELLSKEMVDIIAQWVSAGAPDN